MVCYVYVLFFICFHFLYIFFDIFHLVYLLHFRFDSKIKLNSIRII